MRIAEQTEARGDFQTSSGLYLRAHDILPEHLAPLLKLGALHDRIGEPQSAAEAYRLAVELEPDNADVLRAFGLSLLAAGQTEMALEQFHRALRLAEDPRLYNALGVAYDSTGARAVAQAYYRVGLDMTPEHLTLSTNLALSLALSGENEAAALVLDRVAVSAAASPAHRNMVAVAFALTGDEIRALSIGGPEMGRDELRRSVAAYREIGDRAVAITQPSLPQSD